MLVYHSSFQFIINSSQVARCCVFFAGGWKVKLHCWRSLRTSSNRGRFRLLESGRSRREEDFIRWSFKSTMMGRGRRQEARIVIARASGRKAGRGVLAVETFTFPWRTNGAHLVAFLAPGKRETERGEVRRRGRVEERGWPCQLNLVNAPLLWFISENTKNLSQERDSSEVLKRGEDACHLLDWP